MLPEVKAEEWIPSTESEKAAVIDQIRRIASTSSFNHSKRYPRFLNYVVTAALEGRADTLKERTLGIDVFDRSPDYDSTADPIVRVTAAEIRKRLLRYYEETEHQKELRVLLLPGSYIPQFQQPAAESEIQKEPEAVPLSLVPEQQAKEQVQPFPAKADSSTAEKLSRRGFLYSFIAIFLCAIASSLTFYLKSRPTVYDRFWKPILNSTDPITFCIAGQHQYSNVLLRDAKDPAKQQLMSDHLVAVIIDDTVPLVNIAGILKTHGRKFRIKAEQSTTLDDLRQGPGVCIGAFDNNWTLKLTRSLRYHFANGPSLEEVWIEDSEAPKPTKWLINHQQVLSGNYKDYAIAARFIDQTTGQWIVIAAGLARGGSMAAGEFLTDPKAITEALKQLPADAVDKNLEFVLETDVIGEQNSSPRVVAVHSW